MPAYTPTFACKIPTGGKLQEKSGCQVADSRGDHDHHTNLIRRGDPAYGVRTVYYRMETNYGGTTADEHPGMGAGI